MLLGIINDPAGRSWEITKCKGASAPACIEQITSLTGKCCGYWEQRLELFEWAYETIGLDPFWCEWLDGFTGELLDYNELEQEFFDSIDMEG